MNKLILTGVSMMVALSAVGCGAGPDVAASGDDVGSVAQGPVATPGAAATAAHVWVKGIALGSDGSPLENAEVCLRAHANMGMFMGDCTVSAADGAWTLTGVPANAQVAITIEKPGFVSAVRAITTAAKDLSLPSEDSGLVPVATAAGVMGAALDASQGHIAFFVTGASDVTVDALTLDGREERTTFLDAKGQPDPTLTTGTRGVIANVAAGSHVLTFQSPTASCKVADDLRSYLVQYRVQEASLVLPVVAGHVTSPVRIDCTRTAAIAGK
jgi:hypothetical protein